MNNDLRFQIPTPSQAQTSYDVIIGSGTLSHVGDTLLQAGLPLGPAFIVTQANIAPCLPPVVASLASKGFTPQVLAVDDGESTKSLAVAEFLYRALAQRGATRRSPIIGLGGGVVGDLAGFVAATWKRGAPYLSCPTSLLAMVDGGFGGKTALHLDHTKNLIGAFKFPLAVLCDVNTLTTLPQERIPDGLAEALKHGVIGDPALFGTLEAGRPALEAPFIAQAMAVKVGIVGRDPFEEGERAHLNLGHTIGHALETVSAFELSHGEAVALGLLGEARLARELGMCNAAVPARIEGALKALGLPTTCPLPDDLSALEAAMDQDKKNAPGERRFVLPEAIGAVRVVINPPAAALQRTLESLREPLSPQDTQEP